MSWKPVIYQWGTDETYLSARIIAGVQRLDAHPGETAGAVLKRLPSDTRTFWFHVNLTDARQVPRHRETLLSRLQDRAIVIINGHVTDVCKRTIQARLKRLAARCVATSPGTPCDRWVVVKSNLNHGGLAELGLTAADLFRIASPAEINQFGGPDGYQILQARAVPDSWWADAAMTVESYVDNEQGAFYRVYVAGRAVVISQATSDRAVKRMIPGIHRRNTFVALDDPAHLWGATDLRHQVRLCVRGLRLDYGTLDLVRDNEFRFFVTDVNPTPWWGDEEQCGLVEYLAGGLAELQNRGVGSGWFATLGEPV